MRARFVLRCWFTASLAALGLVSVDRVVVAQTQLPEAKLFSVFPLGGKAGTQLDATANGSDLDDATRMLFAHPGITAEPKVAAPSEFQQPRPLPGQFVVKIAADVPAGVYEVRVAGKFGVSNPRLFVVGTAAEINEKEPNDTPELATEFALDTVVNATADADGVDHFKLPLKKGQRVVVAVRAEALDSRLDATLVAFDANGAEIARSRDADGRDPLVDFVAAADGAYILKVFDAVYRGGPDYFYRVTATTGPYVDFVFPPAGMPGTKAKFTLYGRNLPGGAPANVELDGRPLEQVQVEIDIPGDAAAREGMSTSRLIEPTQAGSDGFEYRLPSPTGPANPVLIGFATAPLVVEHEPNGPPANVQTIQLPCEIVGQFNPRGDVDVYEFQARKGEVYWIDILSQRLGLTTDPVALIQRVTKNDKGEVQAAMIQELDDEPRNQGNENDRWFRARSDDPTYRFAVPDDGTYRLVVRDLHYRLRGTPRFVYRLAIRPAQPDFRAVALPIELNPNQDGNQVQLTAAVVRKGGATPVRIVVYRRDGFEGDVEISAEGLPAGVTATPITIGGESKQGALTFVAAATAVDALAEIRLTAKAKVNGADVVRAVRPATVVWGAQQPQEAPRSRLARGLTVSVVGSEAAPALVEAGEGKVWEMARGGKLEIPIKVTRSGEFKGAINLQARGLPRNVNVGNVNIDAAKPDGKINVNLGATMPPGTYSFSLVSQVQVNNYRRNPQAVEAAKKEKGDIDKLAGDLAKASQAAQQAKQSADQMATAMATAAKQAQDAVTATDKELQQAQQAATAATAKFNMAKEAADKKADDANLKNQAEAAKKASDDATAKLKGAMDKKAAMDKASGEAQGRMKSAADAKQAAEKAATDAQQKSQRAEQVKQQVSQQTQNIDNQNKPKQINVSLVSTPIVVRVTAAPIKLTLSPPAADVNAGDKAELPIKIERLYGFNSGVDLSLSNPNIRGLKASNVSVAGDKTEGKLVIETSKDTPPGEHKLTIEAKMPFGGQITLKQEVIVRVAKKG